MTSFFPQHKAGWSSPLFLPFLVYWKVFWRLKHFPHNLREIQSVLKTGRTAKIHWHHLAVVGRDRHCFIKTKNQYQRRWKAREIMETGHGRYNLKTPIFVSFGSQFVVLLIPEEKQWTQRPAVKILSAAVCSWVCYCAANPLVHLPEWQWWWKLHWVCREVWELLPRHRSCRYKC